MFRCNFHTLDNKHIFHESVFSSQGVLALSMHHSRQPSHQETTPLSWNMGSFEIWAQFYVSVQYYGVVFCALTSLIMQTQWQSHPKIRISLRTNQSRLITGTDSKPRSPTIATLGSTLLAMHTTLFGPRVFVLVLRRQPKRNHQSLNTVILAYLFVYTYPRVISNPTPKFSVTNLKVLLPGNLSCFFFFFMHLSVLTVLCSCKIFSAKTK